VSGRISERRYRTTLPLRLTDKTKTARAQVSQVRGASERSFQTEYPTTLTDVRRATPRVSIAVYC